MWPGSAWAWTTYKQLQPCCCNDRRGQARFQKEGEGVIMQEQVGVSLGCSRRGVWRDTTAPTWTSSCFCSGLPPRGREAGALKQQHSGHSVNGAAIHTQLTAAACDGQPVAPGGSSLGAKMGLLSGDRDEGRRTHGAPTRTPSPMKALVGAGGLREMLERAAGTSDGLTILV